MISPDRLYGQKRPISIFLIAAIPGAISMLASSLYQTLDGMFVGQGLGSTAFAAINLAMPFVIINFAVADLIGVGSSVPISISLGQGRWDEANQIFSSSVLLIVASSTILGALMFILAPFLMSVMGAEGEFHSLATLYLRVYACFSPVTTIVFATDNYMKICGRTQGSMWLNIFMSLCSAALEFLFIVVLGGGVWAAALGTCLAMTVSMVIAITPFAMGRRSLRFVRPRMTKAMIRRILANGTPNFLNNIAGRITSIVMNMMLVRAGGQNAVSVYGVLMYADGLVQPVMYGMVDSLQPAIGYNWGAGKKSRVWAIEKCAVLAALAVCIISFLVLSFMPQFVVGIFVGSAQTKLIAMALPALAIFSYAYLTRWISFTVQSLMLAIEKPRYAAMISLSTAFIFPLILLFLLQGFGLNGIWFNFAGSNILAAIMAVIIMAREWKSLRSQPSGKAPSPSSGPQE